MSLEYCCSKGLVIVACSSHRGLVLYDLSPPAAEGGGLGASTMVTMELSAEVIFFSVSFPAVDSPFPSSSLLHVGPHSLALYHALDSGPYQKKKNIAQIPFSPFLSL